MDEAKATYCFCGCGKRVVNPRLVVTNTNGWELSDELAEWTKLEIVSSRTGLDLSGGDLADNIDRGQTLWLDLREAIHAGERADKEDEKTAVVWRKHAKKARRRLAKQLRKDGLPDPFDMPDVGATELTAWITEGEEPSWTAELDEAIGSTESKGEEQGSDDQLDPVAEKLSIQLGLSVGGGDDRPWLYWIGTVLIDFGIQAFRDMEAITYEGDEPGEPLFPEMPRLVTSPFETEKAARFLAASFPAGAAHLWKLGGDLKGFGFDRWRDLDRKLHVETFEALCDSWELPAEQVTYLAQTAPARFDDDDEFVREHMAFSRFVSMVVHEAYLLCLGKSSDEPPPWDEYVRPSGAVFVHYAAFMRGYLRDLRYYTEEVSYRTPGD
jgi:hypothetical protein